MAKEAEFDIFAVNPNDYGKPEPKQVTNEDTSGNVTVRWQDAVPATAAAGAGAGANLLANKLFPLEMPDQKIAGTERKINYLTGEQGNIAREIEQQRAPYLAERSALTTAADAARMEAQRNEMLLQQVTRRAMELGVDPKVFLNSPETFQRAMSPTRGFGTTNWVNQEIKDLNPLVARDINIKGEAVPAYKEHAATAPRAQQVVGSTVTQPSGIYTPERFGPEQTTAGQSLANVERTYLEAQQAAKEAQAAAAAAPSIPSVPAEHQAGRVENKLMDAKIRLQELLGMQEAKPGVLDRLSGMLSGPKVAAGAGALSAFDIMNVIRELQKKDPNAAEILLSSMGGIGGAMMALPHPGAKVIGGALSLPPLAYQIAPKVWNLGKNIYNDLDKWQSKK